jgi:hypothetical protein
MQSYEEVPLVQQTNLRLTTSRRVRSTVSAAHIYRWASISEMVQVMAEAARISLRCGSNEDDVRFIRIYFQ